MLSLTFTLCSAEPLFGEDVRHVGFESGLTPSAICEVEHKPIIICKLILIATTTKLHAILHWHHDETCASVGKPGCQCQCSPASAHATA